MIRTLLPCCALLAACASLPQTPEPVTRLLGPPDAVPGACYARGVVPAVIETVTEQVMEADAMRAPDGTVLAPARFRTDTSTRIVRPRVVDWFETPCALRDGDATFVRQVQRALQARGLYLGEVHGLYDVPTRAAVEHYQRAFGLESGTLSAEAARALGLVALGRDGA